jgi:hypothetical protein
MTRTHFTIYWLNDDGRTLSTTWHRYGFRHEVERACREHVMNGGRVGQGRSHVTGYVCVPHEEVR